MMSGTQLLMMLVIEIEIMIVKNEIRHHILSFRKRDSEPIPNSGRKSAFLFRALAYFQHVRGRKPFIRQF